MNDKKLKCSNERALSDRFNDWRTIDWNLVDPNTANLLLMNKKTKLHKFGDNTVIKFSSRKLTKSHNDIKKLGASWDFPSYIPHITITQKSLDA